jgi:ribosomal protein S12 methylthiotransferase
MKTKVGFISLGCAKNLVGSEQMLYLLREAGYEITGETDGADAVVVNTCGFIESAKMEAIETILELGEAKKPAGSKRSSRRLSGGAVQGGRMLRELPGDRRLVGVGSCGEIVGAVKTALEGKTFSKFGRNDLPDPETPARRHPSGTWTYLKKSRGLRQPLRLLRHPDIRGPFRSRPIENILREAEKLGSGGIRELIVVAQDTTRYGLDLYAGAAPAGSSS